MFQCRGFTGAIPGGVTVQKIMFLLYKRKIRGPKVLP